MASLRNYMDLLKGPSKLMPIINWTLLGILGFLISYSNIPDFLIFDSNVSIIPLILVIFGINCAWIFTISLNDYYDIDTDKVINPTRPLVSGDLTKNQVKKFYIFFAILSLIFSSICSWFYMEWIIVLVGICLLMGYLYSTPPFRIKMRTPFATIIIGLGCFITTLSGGIIILINEELIFISISLGIIAFIASLVKDFKDISGDKAAGIPTLPTKYEASKIAKILLVVGVISYSFFLIYPIFDNTYYFSYPIIIFAIISWIIVSLYYIKEPNEKRAKIFYILGFLSFLMIIVTLIILKIIF